MQAVHLGGALRELFAVYEFAGGATFAGSAEFAGGAMAGAEAALGARIDQCLNEPGRPRHLLQTRLYVLLRAKDLHRYLTEEPEFLPLKLELMEHLLFHGSPEERWAACREALLSALDAVCGISAGGGFGNCEAYKQQLSRRSSRLGRMLLTIALFNFDLDEEQPPPNLRLRFLKGRFPEYCWESALEAGAAMSQGNPWAWSPANPLCRFEYLGADLLHALLRRRNAARPGMGAYAEPPHGSGPAARAGAGPVQEQTDAPSEVYCNFGRERNGPSQTDQMELFPAQPASFLAELQRQVHRSHGAEGVRLFALLFEQLCRSTCGEFLSLAITEIAEGGSFGNSEAASQRKIRERCKKLWAILEALSTVELTSVSGENAHSRVEKSNLITILGVDRRREAGGPPGNGESPHLPEKVRLLVHPYFYLAAEGSLGQAYRDIPPALLSAPPKDHPYALGLYVYLRSRWQAEGEAGRGVLLRSARQLFDEGGFWLKENARYRSIEALKRELAYLKERGLLGAWRLSRSANRDALDDAYRLEAPGRVDGRSPRGNAGRPRASQPA